MKTLIILFTLATIFVGCIKPPNSSIPTTAATQTKDLVIPSSFNFESSKEVSVNILVKNSSTTLSGVPVTIYLDYPGTTESLNKSARTIGTFLSKVDGRINAVMKLPASQDSLYLKTSYMGIESEAGFKIDGLTATYTYGEGKTIKSASLTNSMKASFLYSFMGSFDSNGVPANLDAFLDKITQGFLDTITTCLPDYQPLPVTHPQYLIPGSQGTIKLTSQANVWLTFVSEGAGYRNAIGYYTYNTSKPPQTINDISKFTIVFPNASLNGSGGGLSSGDKVNLGSFPAGTSIGWFMVSNGWNGTTVTNPPTFFSDDVLNPETDPTKRQHTTLLYDNLKGTLLLSFEDMIRDGSSDEDFNDVVFTVTVTPINSANMGNIPALDPPKDDDGDGVINVIDLFPKDPLRAFASYYPAKDQYTSLIVEDLWPALGDFDFNDLVVDCEFENILSAQGKIVDMYINLKVKAIGASFHDGFGIQLPVAASTVSQVLLRDQSYNTTNISLEPGQPLATVIAFDDAYKLLPSTGGAFGVNVITGNGYRTPQDIQLHLIFSPAQDPTVIGSPPYNPFVFVNGDRSKEIHMANSKPTSKASTTFFGQADDASNPATSTYYKSKKNLVWMMEVPSTFSYDIETIDITKVYHNFGAWAESGGASFKDWYIDNPGYRDNSLIYTKQ